MFVHPPEAPADSAKEEHPGTSGSTTMFFFVLAAAWFDPGRVKV